MAHQVLWNKIVLERFIELSGCTQFQEEVIRLRVAGYSRLEISTRLNVSLSTVDRAISILKKLYDSVQKYDPILPPRERYKNVLNMKDS